MRLQPEHRDLPTFGTVGPEQPPCGGRSVFQVRLENLEPDAPGKLVDLVAGERVVTWIGGEQIECVLKNFLASFCSSGSSVPASLPTARYSYNSAISGTPMTRE